MNLKELKQTEYWKKLPSYKKIYLDYVEYENKQARGEWWFQQISGWFSTEKFIIYTGGLTYYLKTILHWDVSFYFIATSIIIYMVIREILPAIPGHFDFNKKKGLLLLQNKFMATHTNLNPWQLETQETLKEICKELKIKDKYKTLEDKKDNLEI